MYANIPMLNKSIHLIPIIPVYLIIFTVIYGFTKYFLLDFFKISQEIPPKEIADFYEYLVYFSKITAIIAFYLCAFMVIICHLMSMFCNPGENPCWEKDIENVKNLTDEIYCKKCLLVRPERTHHCKICEKCILKMDHHCPWVANCVGLKNLKYFFLFLFYATLGDLIAFICLVSKVFYIDLDSKINETMRNNDVSQWEILMYLKDPLICIISSIFAFFMTVSIGFLFVIQLINILNCKTTIEEKVFKDKPSPYKYDKRIENFESVMGKNKFLWLLPIYYEDQRYNYKKEKTQSNYLSLCDIEDPNMGLNLQEI